jgi:hypothetical protein
MVDPVSQRLQSSCRVEHERVLQGDFKIKVNVGDRRNLRGPGALLRYAVAVQKRASGNSVGEPTTLAG